MNLNSHNITHSRGVLCSFYSVCQRRSWQCNPAQACDCLDTAGLSGSARVCIRICYMCDACKYLRTPVWCCCPPFCVTLAEQDSPAMAHLVVLEVQVCYIMYSYLEQYSTFWFYLYIDGSSTQLLHTVLVCALLGRQQKQKMKSSHLSQCTVH